MVPPRAVNFMPTYTFYMFGARDFRLAFLLHLLFRFLLPISTNRERALAFVMATDYCHRSVIMKDCATFTTPLLFGVFFSLQNIG